ncbi:MULTISPECIES: APC family permease [Clostridium]|uniref:APC family permease n=2 Tax=Clostridium TaxID=1485 RepID=A0ABN4BBB5_9CLOT|nr:MULTISPECIES: APC family permease [Clostridium]ADK15490.1 putative aminoacid transporter [Clostridium ljungdahlii DSM 13528]AGY74720.1 APC family permease [Clostridium autoethanogenum DSM 10061]ALU34900.1 Amino acid permease [Clostridium autoethanogenum DSM 10061]OAA85510.1 Serine/threonine exchanger SteT [Clostridium ljungdahlii DSM 13528]OVY51710.1 Serine/threonine exchanger SteT [Clostridium autoethanogenum]
MESKLEKRYGLITAIAMVIGIVIGSGVFFKAEKVLTATGGNLTLGILAWVIGGIIMISCAYTFAVMATKYQYVNGVVDYAEATLGKKYAYYVGWFMALIYYPTLTSVLAWVSARYTCVLLGFSITGGECMTIAGLYLIASFALNSLSPILAGKFQVSTTIIKLIPLALMAVIGTVVGVGNGMIAYNFTTVVKEVNTSNALFTAVVATAFAYEGWIIATSINAELKDAKKNLPLALVGGTFVIMIIYILYYVGLAGAVTNKVMMAGGEAGAKLAFQTVFSSVGGSLLFVFVIISCLGTLNGLMLGCTRGIYSLAARNIGPKPDVFKQVDNVTNMPTNSSVFGLLLCGIWLLYFYGANLTKPWFGFFSFDSSELPIVTIYALYIPIFVMMMKKEKDLNSFKRFIAPIISLAGCVFMIIAACFSHKMEVVAYLIVFAVVMIFGAAFSKEKIAE